MNDQLERDIRNLFCNTGELSRDEVTGILLGLLERIQHLEQLRPEQEPVAWMVKAHGVVQRISRREDVADEYACYYRKDDPDADMYPLYTTPPHREPLIHEEAPAFKKWFDAWWFGNDQHGVPPRGEEFDDYLERYTLAFGAWMAAKEAAHGIKGEA